MPKFALDDKFQGLTGVFPTEVTDQLVEARYREFPFRKLMGGFDKPIFRHPTVNGNGSSFRVPKFYNLDYKNPRGTFEQKRNYEQTTRVEQCEFTLDKQSFPVLITDQQYMSLATPVYPRLEPMVLKQFGMLSAKNLEWNILKSSTTSLYDITVNGQMPRTERAIFGNDSTVVYTAVNNANLPNRLNAIANVFDATTKPTVQHILACKQKARSSLTEDPINAASVSYVMGYDALEYWMIVGQKFYAQLTQDADYKAYFTTRGVIQQNQPSAIPGCDYIGKIEGVNLVVAPALDEFILGGNKAWSLFFGASAWSVAWHQEMRFARDYDAIDDRLTLVTHETRGLGVVRFPAKTAVANDVNSKLEHGLLHSFTRIA